MTLREVVELHGEPSRLGEYFAVGNPELAYIKLNQAGLVDSVWGRSLEFEGKQILGPPLSGKLIQSVLGEPVARYDNEHWCLNCRRGEKRYLGNLIVGWTIGGFRFRVTLEEQPPPEFLNSSMSSLAAILQKA